MALANAELSNAERGTRNAEQGRTASVTQMPTYGDRADAISPGNGTNLVARSAFRVPRSAFPAVFLDKDGTLIQDVPYNVDPARIRLMPGAAEGIRMLHAAGYRLFVVTNQSGVARGYFREENLAAVAARLREIFAAEGVPLAGFFACPHHPEGTVAAYRRVCNCRKPAPGMILRAARAHGIDLARSWMIGDILDDIEAGNRAGCRTILIDNGGETEWVLTPERMPEYVARDLIEAANLTPRPLRTRSAERGTRNWGGTGVQTAVPPPLREGARG